MSDLAGRRSTNNAARAYLQNCDRDFVNLGWSRGFTLLTGLSKKEVKYGSQAKNITEIAVLKKWL